MFLFWMNQGEKEHSAYAILPVNRRTSLIKLADYFAYVCVWVSALSFGVYFIYVFIHLSEKAFILIRFFFSSHFISTYPCSIQFGYNYNSFFGCTLVFGCMCVLFAPCVCCHVTCLRSITIESEEKKKDFCNAMHENIAVRLLMLFCYSSSANDIGI